MKGKQKNMKRLGGEGLSLETFANLKSTTSHYNPALKKKKREFYTNAKYVKKYKKSLKQQNQQNNSSTVVRTPEIGNEALEDGIVNVKNNKKKGSHGLNELYEKKREEIEKARLERERVTQARKEELEKAEARRKATREKMFKKTRYGQPIMKYRIEHLLETIKGSTRKSSDKKA